MTFTGQIGAIFYLPLRGIINLCVRLRIHPNVLTFIGVVINIAAAWALALGRFVLAGVIMTLAKVIGNLSERREIILASILPRLPGQARAWTPTWVAGARRWRNPQSR